MNNENLLITVGLTTYNRLEMLKKSLESVINQTYKNIEIIIADNHSTDGTEEYCKECATKDSRIRYYRHDKNIGVHENGRFLRDKVKTRYALLFCDDDWISENFIEETVKVINKKQDFTSISSTVYLYDENYNIIDKGIVDSILSNSYTKRMCAHANTINRLKITSFFVDMDSSRLCSDFPLDSYCGDILYSLRLLFLGKMPILKNAIYHKVHNGCTKDLETLTKTFNLEGFTHENYPYKLAQTQADFIINDEFFKQRLNKKKRLKLAKAVYKSVIKSHTPSLSLKDVYGFVRVRPFFFLYRRFYDMLYKFFGLNVDYKFEEYFS